MSFERGTALGILVLLFSAALAYGAAAASPAGAPEPPSDGFPATSLAMTSHLATAEDVEGMMLHLGVRAQGDRYEPVVVDGFGTGLAPRTADEWQILVGNLAMFEVEALAEDLPGSFDLSSDPEFPAVGDQGAQGSCAAWAATYYSYGYMEAVDSAWTEASAGNASQLLSPAWTYNMVNGGMEKGSWMDTNMFVIRDWGVPTLAAMPYDDGDFTSWGSPEAFREAPLHRAAEAGYLEYSASTTVGAIKALVAAGTPVSFAMDANEFVPGFSDGNYILSSAEYSSLDLNHAQTVVGFDDSLTDDSDAGAFRVVNSWGDGWGDSGYYWFTYAALEELGSSGVLTANFIVDIPDYDPSLMAVWHFDAAPSRSSSITVSVGSTPDPLNAKSPFFDGGFHSKEGFPTFMCLDMTEHAAVFWSSGGMHLMVGDSMEDGVVSSLRVEAYEPTFIPGSASQASGQSADVPADTPATVSAYLDYYAPMATGDALEAASLAWSSSGQATWVPVDHHSSGDGDSMQTGDVSDGGRSRLGTRVEGPADVTFDWMVSSQSGGDVLSLIVDGSVVEAVSGDVGWTSVEAHLAVGVHDVAWEYAKDGSSSAMEDAGWVDSLAVTPYAVDPPTISLEDTYYALLNSETYFAPSSLEYPAESEVVVWYDWGDGSPWSLSTSEDGFGAIHMFTEGGEYTLVAYAVDDHGNNVSDSAQVIVYPLDPYEVPSITSVTVSPEGDYIMPGSEATLVVEVVDAEGGLLTVECDFGDGSPMSTLSQDLVGPGDAASFEFVHVYALGSDTAYPVTVVATDDDEHLDPDWDEYSSEVFVNSPPAASIEADESAALAGGPVAFDASGSSDAETPAPSLLFRWDWTGDGVWDTDWSPDATAEHTYGAPGLFDASVEVMDGAGLSSTASVAVYIGGQAIPEFPAMLVPVAAMLIIVLAARSSARRRVG
ncbi:MAG: C1 family peptidase [Candidatus Thermoplasmatota archaeon]